MKITCPSCQKKYNINDAKIPAGVKTAKCKACGHRIKLPVPKESPIKQMPTPVNLPLSQARPRKKVGLYAMAAGVIRTLPEIFQDRRYPHKLEFADNRLSFEINWLKDDDSAFLAALSKANIGQLFAQSTGLTPTPGPVAAEYMEDPHLFTTVDGKGLKPKIPQIVKQSLFPGRYWNFGENPRMTLDLDPVSIPNAVLAKLTYDVKSIQSPDGKDILFAEENKFKLTINPGSAFPGRISLSVKNGTPAASLGTARIRFRLSMPDALQIFEFKSGEETGSRKKSGGIQVTLGRLEKDVADVTASGGKSVRLIAYDKTGQANWEVHFFGHDQPQLLSGNAVMGCPKSQLHAGKSPAGQRQRCFWHRSAEYQNGYQALELY